MVQEEVLSHALDKKAVRHPSFRRSSINMHNMQNRMAEIALKSSDAASDEASKTCTKAVSQAVVLPVELELTDAQSSARVNSGVLVEGSV